MKQIIFSVLILLTVTGCVSRLPEDELRSTRNRLEDYLWNDAMTQSEMNILSQYMLQLANMEKYLLEYRIWNQTGYEKIEKEFLADCKAWEKRADAEAQKPSEFEGGSMAPCDHNLQMASFIEKRIEELKTKWKKK
ncbi:MAG: hypothetical protein IKC82_03170 [Lentisphaeria bacterium]|nr:hypothetical protein [Lentisphaeria bacterium]